VEERRKIRRRQPASLAGLDVAVEDWTRSAGKKPLAGLLDTAIAAVRS
jgi:hypothetical protein